MVDFLIGNCEQSGDEREETDIELEEPIQVNRNKEVEVKTTFKLSRCHYLSSILVSIFFLGFVLATCNPLGFTIFLKESNYTSSKKNQL